MDISTLFLDIYLEIQLLSHMFALVDNAKNFPEWLNQFPWTKETFERLPVSDCSQIWYFLFHFSYSGRKEVACPSDLDLRFPNKD